MILLDLLVLATRAFSRLSAWCAGAFMLLTAFWVAAEVIARKLGSAMISGASEVGGYMLAICSVWAFSYTLLHRSHIRFDIVYGRCGPGTRAVLDFIGLLAIGAFAYLLAYHSYPVLATSIGFDARSVSSLAMPLWIPQGVWFAGFAFLCWTCTILAIRVLVALLRGDFETVSRLAGTVMAQEEAEQEAEEALQDSQTIKG